MMTNEDRLVTVSPEATLKQVAELMLEHGISGLPVVDPERRVVGVISEADIVSGEAGGTGKQGMLARARAFAAEPAGLPTPRTVGEAMSSPAVTIRSDQPVVQAARLIAGRRVNRLPVVDDDERLVGIVTRADIVRAFARSDQEIAREIREAVVERLLGLDPGAVQVTVAEGEVLLTGEVDTPTLVRVVEYFASRVPRRRRRPLRPALDRDRRRSRPLIRERWPCVKIRRSRMIVPAPGRIRFLDRLDLQLRKRVHRTRVHVQPRSRKGCGKNTTQPVRTAGRGVPREH